MNSKEQTTFKELVLTVDETDRKNTSQKIGREVRLKPRILSRVSPGLKPEAITGRDLRLTILRPKIVFSKIESRSDHY